LAEQHFRYQRHFATENPIESEGTYPLPEAQLDRFLFQVRLDYPSADEEREMLERYGRDEPFVVPESVIDLSQLEALKKIVPQIYLDRKIQGYILEIVRQTRIAPEVLCGVSPRGTLALYRAAQAEALFSGEAFVLPQHVKSVALDVLAHRIQTKFEAELQGKGVVQIIERILNTVPVP
jgi:MoxR-like ATPase